MSQKKYLSADDFYFSDVYGSGIYGFDGQMVQDPLGGDDGKGLLSPLLTNVITGEAYFAKRLDCNDKMWTRFRTHVLNPPNQENVLWPCDMISLSKEETSLFSLFVSQQYVENPTPSSEKKGLRALLFPYGGYPKMINGIRKLGQTNPLNWKNPRIRDMAIQIILAVENLNRCGYEYADIHLSRFFFRDDGSVFINFSNLVYAFGDDGYGARSPAEGEYPIEFAEPAYVRGFRKALDFDSQNYSLCALLFYLFFGRYAYDGRLLTEYADDSIMNHYVKFRDYHKMPVFIFDPQDCRNALGEFDEEQEVIELWDECPEILKRLFIKTLSQKNAEGGALNPPPVMWLRCFEKLDWINRKLSIRREDE